jgi:hypothetical protein
MCIMLWNTHDLMVFSFKSEYLCTHFNWICIRLLVCIIWNKIIVNASACVLIVMLDEPTRVGLMILTWDFLIFL